MDPGRDRDEGGRSSASSDEEAAEELSIEDPGAPARALNALNALRKSRQHYDVVLVAGGAEVAAHRAVLAAASPYLLERLPASGAAAPYRVEGVAAPALRALVDYMYTGRLEARDSAAARALYAAAWRLRVEPARAQLAARLLRRPRAPDALAARALPDLEAQHVTALDKYLADNFEEVCESGLNTLPQIDIQMMRESSSAGGGEAAAAVADAALEWLRSRTAGLDELCARTHLLYVDAHGQLQDCGELPAARGDAPELQAYRREAQARRKQPPVESEKPRAPPDHELGARAPPRGPPAVLAARRTAGGCTRALLALDGRLAAARVAWSDVAAGGGGLARGGALGGSEAGERRARMAEPRAAHGAAALSGRLLVCGGYDRARVLRSAEAYDPVTNAWSAVQDLRGPRARFSAARLGDTVWAVGGSDGHNELDSVDAYEAGRGWVARTKLPLALSHAAAAADEEGGTLYVVGGWAGGATLRRVLRYRPAEDEWGEAPALTAGRAQCGAALWEGSLWALGGCDAWHCLASTERLAAGAPSWVSGPAMPTARRSVGAAVWRGALHVVGGSDGAASLRRTERLESGADVWRTGPAMRRARASLALAVLGPALYAAGGFDGKEFLSCVECLYEPDGEWTQLAEPSSLPTTPVASKENGPSMNGSQKDSDTPKENGPRDNNPPNENGPREYNPPNENGSQDEDPSKEKGSMESPQNGSLEE